MATQTGTLIFRPVASKGSITTTVPPNTTVEDCYKLVNEQTSDDDATYVSIKQYESIWFRLLPEVNVNISDVDSIRYYCVFKKNTAGQDSNIHTGLGTWSDETESFEVGQPSTDSWHTLEDSILITEDYASHLTLRDAVKLNNLAFYVNHNASTSKLVLDITQVYLEVVCTYEVVDEPLPTSTIYLKENDSWCILSGTLYQKQNGAWVGIGVDELPIGNTYTIVQNM